MPEVNQKDRERLRKLHAQMGSENDNVRETARIKIKEFLTKHKLTWNDIPELIQPASSQASPNAPGPQPPGSDTAGEPSDGGEFDILELVIGVLRIFVDLRLPHQYLAVALWIVQAHQFRRFTFSPRLALLSPVRRCGKTTLLIALERLLPPTADGVGLEGIQLALGRGGIVPGRVNIEPDEDRPVRGEPGAPVARWPAAKRSERRWHWIERRVRNANPCAYRVRAQHCKCAL